MIIDLDRSGEKIVKEYVEWIVDKEIEVYYPALRGLIEVGLLNAKVDDSGWDVFTLKIKTDEHLVIFFTP